MVEIDGLVTFCILMENNDGILGKSPDYIHEKYEFCTKMAHPEAMLDSTNLQVFDEYIRRWFLEDE